MSYYEIIAEHFQGTMETISIVFFFLLVCCDVCLAFFFLIATLLALAP